MRNVNFVDSGLHAQAVSGSSTYNGSTIDAQQLVAISAQVVATSSAVGSLQLQASNDVPPAGALEGGFTPTNWTNLLVTAVSVSASAPTLISFTNSSYRWLRVSYTNSSGSGNITVSLNAIGLN